MRKDAGRKKKCCRAGGSVPLILLSLILRVSGMELRIDGDNYYHRLEMHDAGTLGLSGALAGFAGGLAKEGYDLYSKSLKGDMPWRESLSDSYKDMKNNIEGLFRGLTHPDENGINWLKNLDIKTNTWKKYE